MPTDIEVIKTAMDDFKKIQEYMLLAKRKNEYLTIKALLLVKKCSKTEVN